VSITPAVARLARTAIERPRTRAGNSSPTMITASDASAVRNSRATNCTAMNWPFVATRAVAKVAAVKPTIVAIMVQRRPTRSAKNRNTKDDMTPRRVSVATAPHSPWLMPSDARTSGEANPNMAESKPSKRVAVESRRNRNPR